MTPNIDKMIGRTFSLVKRIDDQGQDALVFIDANDNTMFKFTHFQACCEGVEIQDIAGDLDDLVHSPLLKAEERTQDDPSPPYDLGQWTFYEFATIKGSVTVRWYGESNGYYSVDVDLEIIR